MTVLSPSFISLKTVCELCQNKLRFIKLKILFSKMNITERGEGN